MLEAHNFSDIVLREFGIAAPTPDLTDWRKMIDNIHNAEHTVRIGLVGKYVQLHDAYLSVAEALRHAGYAFKTNVEIEWIDSEQINEQTVEEIIGELDGVLFRRLGNRGIEGKILARRFLREKNIPYLGICLGMQVAVIDFARHVCGLGDTNSGEFDELSRNKVIDFLPDQSHQVDKGGTLRLGAYPMQNRRRHKDGGMLRKS